MKPVHARARSLGQSVPVVIPDRVLYDPVRRCARRFWPLSRRRALPREPRPWPTRRVVISFRWRTAGSPGQLSVLPRLYVLAAITDPGRCSAPGRCRRPALVVRLVVADPTPRAGLLPEPGSSPSTMQLNEVGNEIRMVRTVPDRRGCARARSRAYDSRCETASWYVVCTRWFRREFRVNFSRGYHGSFAYQVVSSPVFLFCRGCAVSDT